MGTAVIQGFKKSKEDPDVGKTQAVEIFSDHRVAVGAYTNNRVTWILYLTGAKVGFNGLIKDALRL